MILYARTYKIKVKQLSIWIIASFLCSTASFENQWLSGKTAKKYEKRVADVWRICRKAVILHPLSREKRRWVEILNKGTEKRASTSKKTFLKKTSKSFGSSKISLTFASAFEKKVFKEEFFERFRYEQASSTILT